MELDSFRGSVGFVRTFSPVRSVETEYPWPLGLTKAMSFIAQDTGLKLTSHQSRPLIFPIFSGEAACYDSLGLSERPASAGSAALGNGKLMSLALKAREIRVAVFNLVPQAKPNRRI